MELQVLYDRTLKSGSEGADERDSADALADLLLDASWEEQWALVAE